MVFAIFKECLNNVARHSGASRVEAQVGVSNTYLTLRVRDNGPGFQVAAALSSGRRHGVQGMRWRSAVLRGELDVCSGPETRTLVQLSVPLRMRHGRSRFTLGREYDWSAAKAGPRRDR